VSYRFADHTAELQLEIEAPTRAAVFGDAVLALAELLAGDTSLDQPLRSLELVVSAPDDSALLAALLDEIVFVAETETLVPRRLESVDVGRGQVRAVVSFTEAEPRHVVKGATYHELQLARDAGGWFARVVLDV
jgi:SHS2 domain-containing protein